MFKVYDDQDSGNICFGTEKDGQRYFVKFAGAPTEQFGGDPADAISRLKATLPIYSDLKHENLIELIEAKEIGDGLAMVFKWADGDCMGRMYPAAHRRFMQLPVNDRLAVFSDILSFLECVASRNYVAIDFYDGSIMYDFANGKTTICDIDLFRKQPCVNDMGRMWGSSRFQSPEEYQRGADIDEITNVYTLGATAFALFGEYKSVKHKADGTKYKDFYYYGCKHRTMTRGHKCDYKKQIHEELLETAVAEVITKLVSNPKFAALMQQKISMNVDTSAIEQEIANYKKQIRQSYSIKSRLIEEIDTLDPDDKHYIKRKADLDDRLYKMYDKIEDTESLLIEARAKKMAIEAEKLTADNIYKVLIYFDKLYAVMDEQERRQLMESLISEIHIFEERKPNGQWLKSIKFKLPIIEEDMEISLDNDTQVETIVLLQRETL